MTMRSLSAAVLGLGVLLAASTASAQELGEKGQFIISADRLVPLLSYTQDKVTNSGVNPTVTTYFDSTQISLLWGSTSVSGDGSILAAAGFGRNGIGNGGSVPNVYTVPRLGFDYVLLPHLTIGGNAVFYATLGSGGNVCNGAMCNNPTGGNGSGNVFGIVPRVGYVLGLSNLFSLWLRGGVHYYHEHTSTPVPNGGCAGNYSDDGNLELFGLTLDPQFVITPVNHFGFMLGPTVDWGFAGSVSTDVPNGCNARTITSYGLAGLNVGLNGGLMGWF
jgi:hypothetical protein